jgi:hypothetical protein
MTAQFRVSMFADAFGKAPKNTRLDSILKGIRAGRWREAIEPIRATYDKALAETGNAKDAKAAIDEPKKRLPAFCVSGTAQSRTEPLQHSGLLQVDLDGLNSTLPAVREKMKADVHIAFGFVSPSGDGLKCGLRIDGSRHAESFTAAQSYFRQGYGLEIDPAVKDRLRLCFVSYDPDAWTNSEAEPLPLPAGTVQAQPPTGTARTAAPSIIVLPSGSVSISETARAIFQRIGPSNTLFWRGGALVELVTVDGVAGLDIVRPDAFRTRAEKFGNLFAWRSDGKGNASLKPSKLSADDAKAILAATEAREFLPSIGSVLRCPVLTETPSGDAAILGQGYHAELGGLLIVAGDAPPQVPVAEAAEALRWLLEEFSFQSEGDRARAVAALITPALRMGGLIRGNVPVDVAEANASQSGKGHRLEMVATIYNECAYIVTARKGGVGSLDESFSAALVAARPFINLDNLRGKLDSQHLEAFCTAPGLFPARIPGKGEVLVDPKRFILQASSNGLEATRDLANRASICRIRERPGFAYRETLAELRRRQPYFLGAVFSLVAEWIASGKPRTQDCRHHFREWSQILDWIVRELVGCAPLMDGHQAAQERTSNPALSWLRAVALAVEKESRLGVALIASEMVELCEQHAVEIPGKPADEDRAKRQVGSLCKQLFRNGNGLDVDGFTVNRTEKEYRKPSGDMDTTHAYTFAKVCQLTQPPKPTQGVLAA